MFHRARYSSITVSAERGSESAVDLVALRRALHDYIVSEILICDAPLDPSADLFDAGFDSMSLARILVFVEQRYGVVIPDEDVVVDQVTTLEAITQFVASYLRQ